MKTVLGSNVFPKDKAMKFSCPHLVVSVLQREVCAPWQTSSSVGQELLMDGFVTPQTVNRWNTLCTPCWGDKVYLEDIIRPACLDNTVLPPCMDTSQPCVKGSPDTFFCSTLNQANVLCSVAKFPVLRFMAAAVSLSRGGLIIPSTMFCAPGKQVLQRSSGRTQIDLQGPRILFSSGVPSPV